MSDPMQQIDKAAQSVASAEGRGTNWVKGHASILVLVGVGVLVMAVAFLLFRVL